MMDKLLIAGINGFGRFGLHLLRNYINRTSLPFTIGYINDDSLSPERIVHIIKNDKYVQFKDCTISLKNHDLLLIEKENLKYEIYLTNFFNSNIAWIGVPDLFFECSGKNTDRTDAEKFLVKNTKKVFISATSLSADATLVFGYNHKTYIPSQSIISYGSCTVNAFVPLAHFIHEQFTILDSDVHVVHNISEYNLKKEGYSFQRKYCTLEQSGPKLLPFLSQENFSVFYTKVPYSGVSMIDFRFRLQSTHSHDQFIRFLNESFESSYLSGLYRMVSDDKGPAAFIGISESTVFIEKYLKVCGKNLYLTGYFDTENSVTRYIDLVNFVCEQMKK